MHFSAYRHTTMPVVSRSTVDLVFCDLGRAGLVLEGVRDLVTRSARSLGQQVLAAVGTVQPTLEGLPRSARDADAALRALRRQGTSEGTRVVAFDEVRTTIQLDRLLHHLGRHADLLEGRVRVLRDWDQRNDGELAESLLAYLEAFGNVAEGARRIHVHPNTLRYRVRKACAVSGMDLDDPEQRLMAHLQLAALRLS
jgi:DNA-binding PucR family transcriptional regulator